MEKEELLPQTAAKEPREEEEEDVNNASHLSQESMT
jgi:hypothetical protein